MTNIRKNAILYIIETCVLAAGFIFLLNLNYPFAVQMAVLASMLGFYSALGIFRHTRNHDLHVKVVLEYISVSIIVALLFIIINTVRI